MFASKIRTYFNAAEYRASIYASSKRIFRFLDNFGQGDKIFTAEKLFLANEKKRAYNSIISSKSKPPPALCR
jgi:hypothetical protein